MLNVKNDQLEKYKKVLNMDSIESIDSLILKYQDALYDYYETELYDIDKLNIIIESFYYFSGFELCINDYNRLIEIGASCIKSNCKEIGRTQYIYMISMLIATTILKNADQMLEEQLQRNCQLLYKLFEVVQCIDEYENKNINVKKV